MSFRVFFSTLRLRLIILIIFAISPALIITLVTSFEERKIAYANIKEDAYRISKLLFNQHTQLIDEIRHFLFMLSRFPDVKKLKGDSCSELFMSFLKVHKEYHNIGAADISGRVFASALPFSEAVNISDRPYFKLAVNTKNFSIGDYQIGRFSGKPSIDFGYPILDDAGQVRGIVFVSFDLDKISKIFSLSDLPHGSEICLVSKDGLILAHYPGAEKWVGKNNPNFGILENSLSRGIELVDLSGLDGRRRLYAVYPFNNSQYSGNMYLLIGFPFDIVFARVEEVLYKGLAVMIIIGGLAIIAGIVGGNLLILRNLNPIVRATKRIASGDIEARCNIKSGPRELVEIAEAFDEMAGSIEKMFNEEAKAREALKKSEERFKDLCNLIPNAVFELDLDGNITFANKYAFNLFNYSEDDLEKGINAFQLILPEEVERAKEAFKKALIGEKMRDEFNLVTKDGKIFPAIIQVSCITRDGKVIGLRGVAVDISELKDAEIKLQENMKIMQIFINSNPETQLLIDEKGIILMGNETFFRRLGKKSEEVIGHCLYDLLPEDVAQLRKSYFEDVLRSGIPVRFEDNRLDKIYENYVFPVFDEDGKVRKVSILGIDITERKKMEENLRKSEQRFKQLFDEAPVGYHEFDIEGRITEVNQTELQMLGYRKEEMIGHKIWEFTAEGISKDVIERRISEKILSGSLFEGFFRRKDGSILPVMITDCVLRDDKGEVIGIRSTLQDITKLKEAEREKESLEQQFLQAQKMEAIGRLAGGVAHDFNNLLTIIKGYSQLSLLSIKDGDPLRESLNEIQRAADKASSLTRQLLAFSRKQVVEMRPLNLNTVIHDLEKMLRRIIGEDIKLVFNLTEGLGMVKADSGQIEQVLMNLVVNARDAMPDGGRLTIETSNMVLGEDYTRRYIDLKPGPYVMLSISDTGIGMTQEIKEKIFEPFFTTKGKDKGTGLGLSTVYGIVKQMGGNILVYSEPGYGSIFKIYLPVVDENEEKFLRKKDKEEGIPAGSETILIIEDDDGVRNLTSQMLEKQGYKVFSVGKGSDALNFLKEYKSQVHLILTDVIMADWRGPKLIDELRRLRDDFKVLYMSGYIDDNIIHQGVSMGSMERINFIHKPFTFEEITRKIREVLENRSSQYTMP